MNCMATLKHIASKNSDYTAIEAYLVYQHDAFTGKQLLDEHGKPKLRESYILDTAKRPAVFEEQHRAELTAYRAAAAYFKANNITKLPSPKKLEAEYAQLASEKAKFYEQYKEAKEELLKLKTAKQNVASFFREEEQTQQER